MASSVVRALRMLDLLAHAEKPMTLTRIHEALDIPKSTAHGILRDLAREGFVEVGDQAVYSIGLKAFEVGSAHLRLTGAVSVVAGELVGLTRSLNVTSHYAVLDGTEVVYLCKEDPPGLGVQLASSIGARLPSHLTAVGKSCLAWLEPEAAAGHVALRRQGRRAGAVTQAQLRAELAEVRRLGYSTDDGEVAQGIQCVAAPVFDMSGCKGSIGVSFLKDAAQPMQKISREVTAVADRVSTILGGRRPE